MTPIDPYRAKGPKLDSSVFVAKGGAVIGDVEIGEESSVWFNAVIRADTATVRIGARTNVQDGAVIHTDTGKPCRIGDDCTVGHNAVVHGCTIGHGCLIGIGAMVLSGAVIGDQSIIGAGALVPEGREFPARSVIIGLPGKVARRANDEDLERIGRGVQTYLRLAREYRNDAR
jgi:carbonic anhydrase/acetyltransferase-like protein (isoleucine patch superfamily)